MDRKVYLNNKAAELSAEGDLDGAEKAFREALSESKDDPLVCFNLGLLLLKKGRREEALRYLDSSLEHAEEEGRAGLALDCGLACYESALYENAERYYNKASENGASGGEYWNRRGVLFFVTGKYGKARESFEKAVADEPGHLDAWYNLADTFEMLGMNEKALEARAQFLSLEKTEK